MYVVDTENTDLGVINKSNKCFSIDRVLKLVISHKLSEWSIVVAKISNSTLVKSLYLPES